MTYRRYLTDEEKEKFAYELALGYYTNDELRHVFKLYPINCQEYLESDEIKRLVMMKRREIDESDQAVRIHARRAARAAIDQNVALVKDADAPARVRMAASKEIRDFAVVADKKAIDEPIDGPIIIRTNLDLKDASGVYTVTRREIDQQIAENAKLEAGEDDFSDILGVPA